MNVFIKMKKLIQKINKDKSDMMITRIFITLICVAAVFLIYISFAENIQIYNERPEHEFSKVEDYNSYKLEDNDMSVGVKTQYKWKVKSKGNVGDYLVFYVVHQYAEVYFDGDLVYSLKPHEGNKIGKTTASNWVAIPIHPEDDGKEICINIIPAYKAVKDKVVNFYIGSKSMIYHNQIISDMPQIILSLFAIVIGIAFTVISVIHKYKRNENINLLYLGIFALSTGIWKITDVRSAPLIFTNNTLALSYISITMLIIATIPWMLSIKKQFLKNTHSLIDYIIIFSCIGALAVLIVQITNITDLRETLIFTHILIIIETVSVVSTVIYEGHKKKINRMLVTLYICLALCTVGVILDMISYYVTGSSAMAFNTLLTFLIYIITMGYMSLRDINFKANIDMHTGLYNKGRCNELMDENEIIHDSLGIFMFDLNGLKYMNDRFGHESGDTLIYEFANILRKSTSNSDFVGRYGGDEFIVVIREADEESVSQVENKITKTVEYYNMRNKKIHMSYAVGYALSDDYPGLSLRELLQKADYNMYKNKKEYHLKYRI